MGAWFNKVDLLVVAMVAGCSVSTGGSGIRVKSNLGGSSGSCERRTLDQNIAELRDYVRQRRFEKADAKVAQLRQFCPGDADYDALAEEVRGARAEHEAAQRSGADGEDQILEMQALAERAEKAEKERRAQALAAKQKAEEERREREDEERRRQEEERQSQREELDRRLAELEAVPSSEDRIKALEALLTEHSAPSGTALLAWWGTEVLRRRADIIRAVLTDLTGRTKQELGAQRKALRRHPDAFVEAFSKAQSHPLVSQLDAIVPEAAQAYVAAVEAFQPDLERAQEAIDAQAEKTRRAEERAQLMESKREFTRLRASLSKTPAQRRVTTGAESKIRQLCARLDESDQLQKSFESRCPGGPGDCPNKVVLSYDRRFKSLKWKMEGLKRDLEKLARPAYGLGEKFFEGYESFVEHAFKCYCRDDATEEPGPCKR